MERVCEDHLGLGAEDDHQRQEQPCRCHVVKPVHKDVLQVVPAPAPCDKKAGQNTCCQRNHHKEEDTDKERAVGNTHLRDAEQKPDDGDKCRQDDQIVGRHLHHRVGGISVHQGTPDKDHRRAGRCPQKDGAGQVLGCQFRRDRIPKDHEQEQIRKSIHGEGLDQPVHHPGHKQALRVLPDFPDALKVHLEHHRVDHDPDEDRDGDRDPRDLEPCQYLRDGGKGMADQDARRHAEEHPDRKVGLEKADTAVFSALMSHLIPPSPHCNSPDPGRPFRSSSLGCQ